MRYQQDGVPLCVLAGKEYGTGSSRDWAAKGTFLLGVKFVLAESYERIHRSNLVGMGVLPLQFRDGETRESLGLTGNELFDVAVDDRVAPRQQLTVTATNPETGKVTTFVVLCRIDTPVEVDYYRNGGILQTVLRKLLGPAKAAPKAKSVDKVKPATKKPGKPAPKVVAKAKAKAKQPVAKKPVAKKPIGKAVAKRATKPLAKSAAAKKAVAKKAVLKPQAKKAAKPRTKPAAKKPAPKRAKAKTRR